MPMMIVHKTLQNCKEVFSVCTMNFCMVTCVACVIVTTQKYHLLTHVYNIKIAGTNMLYDMGDNQYLGFVGWSDVQSKKDLYGFLP